MDASRADGTTFISKGEGPPPAPHRPDRHRAPPSLAAELERIEHWQGSVGSRVASRVPRCLLPVSPVNKWPLSLRDTYLPIPGVPTKGKRSKQAGGYSRGQEAKRARVKRHIRSPCVCRHESTCVAVRGRPTWTDNKASSMSSDREHHLLAT